MASITANQLMLAVADSLGAALAAHEMGAIGETHLRNVMKAEIDRLQNFAESEGSLHLSAPPQEPALLHEMNPPSPWQPERDAVSMAVLGKFAEELGECSAAVARCLIQGIRECEPVTKKPNRDWLEDEIADVLAGADTVIRRFNLERDNINPRFERKKAYLAAWHELIAAAPALPGETPPQKKP